MAKIDFEKSLTRLETIVGEMETGELSLDKMLAKFKEGMALAEACSKRLNEAERTIEVLVKGADGAVETKPFPGEDESAHEASQEGRGGALPF